MSYSSSPDYPVSKSLADTPPRVCGISRKVFVALVVTAAILIVGGLGVGLGVGLSRSSESGSGSPPPPLPPGPSPPGGVMDLPLDGRGNAVLGPGGGPALEGGGCSIPADCARSNSSCIFPWAEGAPDTSAGFCAANKLPDMYKCTKDEDCHSESCRSVEGAGGGDFCGSGEGAPCSRNDQCAVLCRRPFCGPNRG